MNKPIEALTEEGTAYITDEQFVTAFNSLSKARRIRLITTMAKRLAEDVINVPYPGPDASAEEMAKWDRAIVLEVNAGMDTTMWSEEMEAEYEKQDFTREEELAMSLWSIRETGARVRESILAKNAAKIINTEL